MEQRFPVTQGWKHNDMENILTTSWLPNKIYNITTGGRTAKKEVAKQADQDMQVLVDFNLRNLANNFLFSKREI